MFELTEITFVAAPPHERAGGLLGWVAATLDGRLRFDGLTLRRTLSGRLAISFPARRDGAGKQHPIVRPLDGDTRRSLERQILDALASEVAS